MLELIQHDNDGLFCLGDGIGQPAQVLLSTAVTVVLAGGAIAGRVQTGGSQGVLNVIEQLRRVLVFLVQGQPGSKSSTLEQLVSPLCQRRGFAIACRRFDEHQLHGGRVRAHTKKIGTLHELVVMSGRRKACGQQGYGMERCHTR